MWALLGIASKQSAHAVIVGAAYVGIAVLAVFVFLAALRILR